MPSAIVVDVLAFSTTRLLMCLHATGVGVFCVSLGRFRWFKDSNDELPGSRLCSLLTEYDSVGEAALDHRPAPVGEHSLDQPVE